MQNQNGSRIPGPRLGTTVVFGCSVRHTFTDT